MGTHSLTIVQEDGRDIITMYRQFDGYPEGHGQELFEKFGKYELINGIPMGVSAANKANGIGCFAAQIVAHFKTEVGGFYLHPSGTRDVGEEYIYTLFEEDGVIFLRASAVVWNGKSDDCKLLYRGPLSMFGEWIANHEAA